MATLAERTNHAPPLVAIGASAGGIEALRVVLPSLPADFPAAVAVVVHRGPVQEDDRLTTVLARNARLPVGTAGDFQDLQPGRIYVCPAGVHLVVERNRFRLTNGARENGSRPAIDVLFRSAALCLGERAAAVILSGMLDDGTAGLAAIKARGGFTVVQDPNEALFADMPRNALENVDVDAVLPVAGIGAVLEEFALRAASRAPRSVPQTEEHVEPSLFSCPDCGGVLSQVDADGVVRFRCRIGHAYSPRTLFSEQDQGLEAALSTALRVLVERRDMSERLARRSRERGLHVAAQRFEQQAAVARRRADTVRAAIEGPQTAIDAALAAGETAEVDGSDGEAVSAI